MNILVAIFHIYRSRHSLRREKMYA